MARELRVSVQRLRKAWSQGGERAPAFKGPASLPLLSDELFRRLGVQTGQGADGTRLAGLDLDSGANQDSDRPTVPSQPHVQGVAALFKRHGWACHRWMNKA
jgi:hypothetical protein